MNVGCYITFSCSSWGLGPLLDAPEMEDHIARPAAPHPGFTLDSVTTHGTLVRPRSQLLYQRSRLSLTAATLGTFPRVWSFCSGLLTSGLYPFSSRTLLSLIYTWLPLVYTWFRSRMFWHIILERFAVVTSSGCTTYPPVTCIPPFAVHFLLPSSSLDLRGKLLELFISVMVGTSSVRTSPI